MGAELHGFTTPAAQTLSSHLTLDTCRRWGGNHRSSGLRGDSKCPPSWTLQVQEAWQQAETCCFPP